MTSELYSPGQEKDTQICGLIIPSKKFIIVIFCSLITTFYFLYTWKHARECNRKIMSFFSFSLYSIQGGSDVKKLAILKYICNLSPAIIALWSIRCIVPKCWNMDFLGVFIIWGLAEDKTCCGGFLKSTKYSKWPFISPLAEGTGTTPSLACHSFAKGPYNVSLEKDPTNWDKGNKMAFVSTSGINSPFLDGREELPDMEK